MATLFKIFCSYLILAFLIKFSYNTVANNNDFSKRNLSYSTGKNPTQISNDEKKILLQNDNLTNGSTSLIKNKTLSRISTHQYKSLEKNISESYQPKERIIRGELARKGQFPYQAGILVDIGETFKFLCGGSILNESFVLTAAHCYIGPKDYYVFAGVIDREDPTAEKHKVEKFIRHPHYLDIFLLKDLAIIKIYGKFWIGNSTEYIAPIPLIDYKVKTATQVIVSGWGREKDDGLAAKYLRFTRFRVYSHTKCIFKNIHLLSGMLCLKSETSAVCQGDSGGPGVVDGKLAAVVSWGKGKCESLTNPDVYTDVYHYRNWILYNNQRRLVPNLLILMVNFMALMALY